MAEQPWVALALQGLYGEEAYAFLAVVLIEPPFSSARIGRLCYTQSRTNKREARKVDITAGGG